MSKGCQEGKATPKLTEVLCPECGEIGEVFVHMGGSADKTGRLASDEKCPKCGDIFAEGTPVSDYERA